MQRRLLEIEQPSLHNSQYHNNLPSTAITQLPSHNHSTATLHTTPLQFTTATLHATATAVLSSRRGGRVEGGKGARVGKV